MSWRDDPELRRTYGREYYRKNLAAKPGWTKERKTTPGASVSPTTADLHWAAGFFDGEGHISIYHRQDGVGIGVSVTNCDLEPLQRFQCFFGGRINKKSMGPRNRQQPYYWGVYGARALGVIQTLYSILSSRRQTRCRAALKAVVS